MQPLSIQIAEEYIFLVKTTLFDTNHKTIEPLSSKPNLLKYKLPSGLYTLRTEINGAVKDEVFWFEKKQTIQVGIDKEKARTRSKTIYPPKQYSSALLTNDYAHSPDYYTKAAVHWSGRDTHQLNTDNHYKSKTSSLFLFLRFSSILHFEKYKMSSEHDFWSDFELLNEQGISVFSFESGKGLFIDNQLGFFALNIKLPFGIYYLHCKGEDARQIPIYLFKNWHTQFFMTLGEQINYGTIRIFLSKERLFNPNEKTHQYIDLLLDKLQNEDYSLEPEMIKMVAGGKYESPILAIICSYIYLKSKDLQNDQLFMTILDKLQNEILKDNQEAPDLRALSILAAKHFPKVDFKKSKIDGSPMFRIGYEGILNASIEHKSLVAQQSVNDFIVENRYFDSPFNTFRPIVFPNKPSNKQMIVQDSGPEKKYSEIEDDKQSLKSKNKNGATFNKIELNSSLIKDTRKINDLLSKQTIKYIKKQSTSPKQNSWLKASIATLVTEDANTNMKKISQELCIPASTVNRVFKEWQKEIG